MDKTIPRRMEMVCGSYMAEVKKYYPFIMEDGAIWLIAHQPNMADNVYYCNFDPKSQGFAGRTLHFELVDGDSIDLPAPWHSNADALFYDTGIDIRDTSLTYTIIAKQRSHDEHYNTIYKDVLYEDRKPTLGYFNRGEILAKEFANKLHTTVFCYRSSQGGSSDGPIEPDKKEVSNEGNKNPNEAT